jgi:hypothetical protein
MQITDMRFQSWLDGICLKPMPNNFMMKMRTLVREVAEGSLAGFWPPKLFGDWAYLNQHELNESDGLFPYLLLQAYCRKRWFARAELPPPAVTAVSVGYAYSKFPVIGYSNTLGQIQIDDFWLTKASFRLLDHIEDEDKITKIFVSYKRDESSAFALLTLARLKGAGFEVFLDMSLEPGKNWLKIIQQRIQESDVFILILGKHTLTSDAVLRELQWAVDAEREVIPIWHDGFVYSSSSSNLLPDLDYALSSTHTIRVLDESALGYNNAIVELLNRFGVTP